MLNNYIYTTTILNSLEVALSSERLAPYVSSAKGDKKFAICLYLWNAQLSESLQIAVHIFEVTLRNAIHQELSSVYGDCWYDNPRLPIRSVQQDMIQQVKYNLLAQSKSITPSRMVSGLTMGFWISLLAKRYETLLWRNYLHKAFSAAPNPLERAKLHLALNQIKTLRNRIAHHEPILFLQPDRIYNLILEIISWVSPDTANWVGHHCRFNTVWADRPRI